VERNEDNEEGYEPRFQRFLGEDTRGKTFGIRGIGVSVVKVELRKNVAGGLGSKSKKWKLVVGGA